MIKKDKILIIGGSRFLGPAIINELLKGDYKITVFNRGEITKEYPDGVIYHRGDRNTDLGTIKEKFDLVIDTCAYNSLQVKKVFEQLKFGHYLQISTAAVYKKTNLFPLKENQSEPGKWPLWGNYNKCKLECERVALESTKNLTIIRPVYILGKYNHVNRESFIYSKLKSGKTIILPGDGQAITQFVSVGDTAKEIALIAEKKFKGIFNCCGDETITLEGLVKEMAKIVGVKAHIKYNHTADGPNFDIKEFPFANENFFCSNEKIKNKGATFTPFLKWLANDYEHYYKNLP